ncbi:MAG: endonuclease/exonuclease/phosphatase family protein [Bacteroidetes bacterium]|nr:endonuclease/exonuclease/phosphatase family protein [Bacteroidota bacterium]
MLRNRILFPVLLLFACADRGVDRQNPEQLRFMEFNAEDIRTSDLRDGSNPRLRQLAEIVQAYRPDVLMISEFAYDYEGVAGYDSSTGEGANGDRLIRNYLGVPQREGLEPISYSYFARPTNTGVASGLDLDNSGNVSTEFPPVQTAGADGQAPRQTREEREYGNDAWGFGTFPGQYGMLLLVRPDIEILTNRTRTFQHFKWSQMPGALEPADSLGNKWYSSEEWQAFRLSSKSHWDVPIRLENGGIVHLLLAHPTPPAFDGPEQRNKKRNHDEIRFWGDYIRGADYIVDDAGRRGGLPDGASFVIMGDLNADVDEGSSFGNPVEQFLFSNSRVNSSFVPRADSMGAALFERLDADDTAQWGLRVDYVLPSSDLTVVDGGIVRRPGYIVSDHFPVWLDVDVPGEDRRQ